MTTPGGVPNLPQGALTIDTLASNLKDMTGTAMKSRAVARFPGIFNNSTGLDPSLDITPFGILTAIWAEVNSLVANADPADVQGPEDLPELVLEFIEGLPVIGQFVGLLEAILGTYDGDDEVLLTVQDIFAPIRALVTLVPDLFGGLDLTDPSSWDPATIWSTVITALINPLNLLAPLTGGLLSGGVIPGLDASKITSGTFSLSMIAGLLTSGTITTSLLSVPLSVITGLLSGGSILGSLIPGLDASKITTGTFGLGFIPNLPASQITSGTFGTGLIPNLPASIINSGSFLSSLIPSLDASKITTGTFGAGFIPNITKAMSTDLQGVIDAAYQATNGGSSTGNTVASVKTGLLNFPGANIASSLLAAVIPSLDASKITTGAFGTGQIPNLPASIINSGTFVASLIPSLDASKITTGTFSDAVSGVGNVWNSIVSAFGGSGSGQTQSTATAQLTSLNGRVTTLEGGGVLTQYTTNATWTKPTNGTDGLPFTADEVFTIICICGGNGGYKPGTGAGAGAAGGFSGGYVSRQVKYSDLASSYSMTIGAAGAGATSEGAGASGGTTSFGTLVVGNKGLGAVYKDDGSYAAAVPPGMGGVGCTRLTTAATPGQSGPFAAGGTAGSTSTGGAGSAAPAGIPSGGAGGGGGGTTSTTASAGGAGGFPGGGGGGGAAQGTSNFGGGGAGAAGCIYVIAPH